MAEKRKASAPAPEAEKTDGRLSVWRVVGLTVIIVLFIAAAAVVISGRGGRKAAQQGSVSEGDGLVYAVSADSVLDLKSIPGRLALLQPTRVLYIDEAGNEIASNEHKYASPVMLTAGKNALVYDAGGESLRVEKNAEVFSEVAVSAPITCADICGNGTYAYVLNADAGYQSHLYVYSYKGEKLFEWGSASDYVLGVRLSASGKHIVVNELHVENAEHSSKVLCFKFGREEPVFSVDFSNMTVYDTKFISAENTIVYTDKGVFRIMKDGAYEEVVAYAQNELNHSCLNSAGLSLIALNLFGNEKNAKITVFDKRFKKFYDVSLDAAVTNVCAADSACAVVSGDTVHMLNSYGTVTGNEALAEKCFGMTFSGRKLFILTAAGLSVFQATDETA